MCVRELLGLPHTQIRGRGEVLPTGLSDAAAEEEDLEHKPLQPPEVK